MVMYTQIFLGINHDVEEYPDEMVSRFKMPTWKGRFGKEICEFEKNGIELFILHTSPMIYFR